MPLLNIPESENKFFIIQKNIMYELSNAIINIEKIWIVHGKNKYVEIINSLTEKIVSFRICGCYTRYL